VIAGRVAMVLLVMAALVLMAPLLSFIEVRAFDLLLALRPSRPPDPRVQILDIGADPDVYERFRDPRDSRENGCEVPRLAYAAAVQRLSRWGAKVIVFDMMFSRHCTYEDERVAEAFRRAGNVIVAASTKVEPGAVGLRDPVEPIGGAVSGVGSPAAHQPNETIRSIPLVVRDRDSGREYLALSLVAFQRFLGERTPEVEFAGEHRLTTGGLNVPVLSGERIHLLSFGEKDDTRASETESASGVHVVAGGNVRKIHRLTSWSALLVNWAGPQGTLRPRQLSELLAINSDEEGRRLYGGKAVIIGKVDWDVHWTSLGAMPGLEIQANALETLISQSFIRPISPWGMLGLISLFCFTTASAVRRFKGARGIGAVLLLMVAAVVLARQLLAERGIWMYLFYCELGICLTWGMAIFLESGKATALLGRFVPAFMGQPETRDLREIRTLDASILFSDIRGYTGTAEQLSATDTMSMLNQYHATVEEIIARFGGTIVKTPGDAILAVFWKDVRGLNHAACAVRSGQEMLHSLPTMARVWEEMGVNLQIGVGINAGQVAMGLVGTRHLEPTVIGDPVNVAQRLESLTKTLGRQLIFSESVRELVHDTIETVYLDEVTVSGRKTPLRIYSIAGAEVQGPTIEHPTIKETTE
jgi:class 3 adenylate cyclase/CHASE2 domain-containing sensor protein